LSVIERDGDPGVSVLLNGAHHQAIRDLGRGAALFIPRRTPATEKIRGMEFYKSTGTPAAINDKAPLHVRILLKEALTTEAVTGSRAAPTSETERKLTEMWTSLLEIDETNIGVDDNFFELGGHSLKATTMVSGIHKAFDIKIPLVEVFKNPSIRVLAGMLDKLGKNKFAAIEPAEKKEYYLLSAAQKRLLILQQMKLESTAYNMPHTLPLATETDIPQLETIFAQLIQRHESLRTTFHLMHETPVQKIHPTVQFKIETLQLDETGEINNRIARAKHTFFRPFELTKAPLLRAAVVEVKGTGKTNTTRILLLDMHHIITDGTSQDILTKELYAIHAGENLPPIRIQYRDYAQWQNSRNQKEHMKQQEEVWTQLLSGELPVLALPTDYPRPLVQTFEGSHIDFDLNKKEVQQLKKMAKENQATLYMTILSLFTILLSKLSGQEDIIVGMPIAGRRHIDLERIIGMFVNTLAMRNHPEAGKIYKTFLREVKERTLTAFENQDYQFEDLVDRLSVRRDTGRNPVFEVVFNFLNQAEYNEHDESIFNTPDAPNSTNTTNTFDTITGEGVTTSKFDLALNVFEKGDGFNFYFEYSTKLFKEETIKRFITYLKGILQTISAEPGQKLSEIEIITAEERRQILNEFNNTETEYPRDKTIHQLFREQVEKTPDRISTVGSTQYAVGAAPDVGGIHESPLPPPLTHESLLNTPSTQSTLSTLSTSSTPSTPSIHGSPSIIQPPASSIQLTYRELDKKSNRLASHLKKQGAGTGTIVAIMPERTIEMIIALLAILKTGAAYLPIDPGYPRERIDYMLKDSNAGILLKEIDESDELREGVEIIEIQSIYSLSATTEIQQPESGIRMQSFPNTQYPITTPLAYIIYTSGTTGHPKAVMVEHRSVVRLIANTGYIEFNRYRRLLQTGTLSFDASTFEIWGALENGLTLYLVKKEDIISTANMKKQMARNGVELIWMTSALFNHHVQEDIGVFKGIKHLLVGGDVVSPGHVNRLRREYPGITVTNGYGPTENTTFSTSLTVEREYYDKIPIGKPISNSTTYIVTKSNRLCPIGVPGELLVGGDGLARGYLNSPELTAERFVKASRQKETVTLNESFAELFQKRPPGGSAQPRMTGPPEAILYRTGDLARWQPDGNIEYLGRIDHQVKIRGFRIELEEIENNLLKHPEIKEAVVLAHEERGEKYLCAYYVSGNRHRPVTPGDGGDAPPEPHLPQEPEPGLAAFLTQTLPDYMIPAIFIPLEKIPLTPNGKIDRKTIALYPVSKIRPHTYTAPRNKIEEKIVEIWKDVLEIHGEKISVEDDFFRLGGHSLKATVMAARIHKEFNAKIPLTEIFNNPSVRMLSEILKKYVKEKYTTVKPVEKKEYYPLSAAQKRLYVLQQMEHQSTAYNMPQTIPLSKETEPLKLEAIFRQLIRRHESLRTSFHLLDETPVQKIHPSVLFKIETLPAGETGVNETKRAFFGPFDLAEPPLLRVGIIKTTAKENNTNERYMLVDMHHIITDGTSQTILTKELFALIAGKELPPLTLQYKDYAGWQNSTQQKKLLAQQETFWLSQYPGEYPVLNLPTDYPRPKMQRFEGQYIAFPLKNDETENLKETSKKNGTTLYMTLLSIYTILLAKLSGQEDIIVGTPTAGRLHTDLENIIGMFVNTLPMRNYPAGEKTIKTYLGELKTKTLEAFENQEYQFEDLVDRLTVRRDTARNPLFDVMLNLLNQVEEKGQSPTNDTATIQSGEATSKFDITLSAIEDGDRMQFQITYSRKLFKETTIKRVITYLKKVMHTVTTASRQNKELKIGAIEIITREEKRQILYEYNDTAAPYPENKTIHQLFREQAAKTPGSIAVAGNRRQGKIKKGEPARPHTETPQQKDEIAVTYGELDKKSDQLAQRLKEKGIAAGSIIGLMVDPIPEMIIGIMAVLKAGGTYLPLNPETPPARVAYMLKDSNAQILLVQKDRQQTLNLETKTIAIDNPQHYRDHTRLDRGQLPNPTQTPDDCVYLIYTSGTTGKPKGVPVKHRNLVNYVTWFENYAAVSADDRTLLTSSFAFDLGYTSIYPAILMGGQLFITPKEIYMSAEAILEYIYKHRISYLKMTPSLFSVLVENPAFPAAAGELRLIVLGGEAIDAGDVEKAYRQAGHLRIMNHYGPTEVTIGCIAQYIEPAQIEAYKERPTIGKPISNTRVYIVDKYFNQLPPGVAGELYLGGTSVARGYLNRPELTAERFVKAGRQWAVGSCQKEKKQQTQQDESASSFPNNQYPITNTHLYRTGDLARRMLDGSIEFLGRIDHQVKIRGYRIEFGEIENRLLSSPGIKKAAVLAQGDNTGDKYLCAYFITGQPGEYDNATLKKYLSQFLPDYMIPAHFVKLEEIPLTPNGKIDRKVLSKYQKSTLKPQTRIAPRNEMETKLNRIWAETLKIKKEEISIESDFFQIGGHSLKATVLVSKIHKEFDIKLPLTALFNTPTIKALAKTIKGKNREKYHPLEPIEKKEYYPLSSAQKRLYVLHQMELNNTAYNMPRQIPLTPVIPGRVGPLTQGGVIPVTPGDIRTKLEDVFRKLIQRHESLRTTIHLIDDTPVQKVHPYVPFQIERVQPGEAGEDPEQAFFRQFDLAKAPLIRVGISGEKEGNPELLLDMHHIITDGISQDILTGEFLALIDGRGLAPLTLQYRDYAAWQSINTESMKQQEAYWLKQFSGELPVLELPTDYPRPVIQSFEGDKLFFELNKKEAGRLKETAKTNETTLYMTLLSIFTIEISKLSGQEDIIVGTPTAGRGHADLQNIIGMFVNTLVIRNNPDGNKTFNRYLGEIKENTLNAFDNQEYQFEDIVDRLSIRRDTGRNPLFDVMFNLINQPEEKEPGTTVFPEDTPNTPNSFTSKFDLTLSCFENGNKLYFTLEYSTKLFKEKTINKYITYFKRILQAVHKSPHRKLSDIELLSEEEKNQILYEFNDTAFEYPCNKTIHQLFVE
ncbi:MAG: amino acid adenylation domain-containing protein, partial [bacterium]|nr:amino acid adenylation domain-containing protein [bacterium]